MIMANIIIISENIINNNNNNDDDKKERSVSSFLSLKIETKKRNCLSLSSDDDDDISDRSKRPGLFQTPSAHDRYYGKRNRILNNRLLIDIISNWIWPIIVFVAISSAA